jgi:hypothetical protein
MDKEKFKKRLKSFAWRSLVVFLLGFIGWISGFIPELNLPEIAVVFVGLIANEATKWLNNSTDLFGGRLK